MVRWSPSGNRIVLITNFSCRRKAFHQVKWRGGSFDSTCEGKITHIDLLSEYTKSTTDKELYWPHQDRRWDGDFRTLRHLVEEKAFGTIYDATMHYDIDNPPWYKTSTEKAYIPGNGLMYGLGMSYSSNCWSLRCNQFHRQPYHGSSTAAFWTSQIYHGLLAEFRKYRKREWWCIYNHSHIRYSLGSHYQDNHALAHWKPAQIFCARNLGFLLESMSSLR